MHAPCAMAGLKSCGVFVVCLVMCLHHGTAKIMFIAERLPLKGDRELADVPWPMPREWSRDNVTFTLNPSTLTVTSNLNGCDVIDDAIERYQVIMRLFKQTDTMPDVDIAEVKLLVENTPCEKYPFLDMDESYTISTGTQEITVRSETIWGILRGLETLSQLVYEEDGQVRMRNWTIADSPRFSHRGFLIDTARHYLPLSIIKKHLDAMAWSKMNVLHWHLVDSQSFPYVSRAFPELSNKGAFSPRHVYTPEAVSEVIEYARLRGIRVVPEFDTPGHAGAWGKGQPDLLTSCWHDGMPERAEYGQHADRENFDPTKETTYQFVEEFMQEVAGVFPDEFLHAGMDEAHYMCWKSSPNISQFMTEKNITSNSQLEQYYVTKALDIISGTGKHVIIWQDPLDNGVVVINSTIIEIWKSDRSLSGPESWGPFAQNASRGGNRLIVSSCWYLNYISYGQDWKQYYGCDPHSFTADPDIQARVVGGEACMWAEYVDGTNLLQRAWPRAAAVAERLWSPSHVTDVDTAAFRLDAHRCRLLRRGIPAQPILPGYCGDYDFGFELDDKGNEEEGKETTGTKCTVGAGARNHFSLPALLLSLLFIFARVPSA